jgi:hypothetical protein
MANGDWIVFGSVLAAAWALGTLLLLAFWPRMILGIYRRAILGKGIGEGPIPINSLSTEPQSLFADPLHARTSASNLATIGVNRDTLLTVGCLDLKEGPQVLRVPDMAGRYYSVQLTDLSDGTNFAYVGKRTTGTKAGRYLVTGPGWKGAVPEGMTRIPSPRNAVLVVGRVLVMDEGDLPAAHGLAKQIGVAPLVVRP